VFSHIVAMPLTQTLLTETGSVAHSIVPCALHRYYIPYTDY